MKHTMWIMWPKILLILTAVNIHTVSSQDVRCGISVSTASVSYAALDIEVGPTSTVVTCQSNFLSLPSNWIIAPVTADSISVLVYPWGTHLMVIQGGRQYYTKNSDFPEDAGKERTWVASSAYPTALAQEGTQYKVNACYRRILLKYAGSSLRVSSCPCNTATLLLL